MTGHPQTSITAATTINAEHANNSSAEIRFSREVRRADSAAATSDAAAFSCGDGSGSVMATHPAIPAPSGSHSELHCDLDAVGAPRHTRLDDDSGLHWPGCYAGGVAARYLAEQGARAALNPYVWEHLAFVHGWSTWREDRA